MAKLTMADLREHVGHSIHVRLVVRPQDKRVRSASGTMDALRDNGMSLIGRYSTERRIRFEEIEYLGCSTDGFTWPGNVTVTFTPEQATAVLFALDEVRRYSDFNLGAAGVTGGKTAIREAMNLLSLVGAKKPEPYTGGR
jgi:hypothetical protein